MATALALLLLGYLSGGIPFGLLIARARGVELRARGSGNIGATNAARVLGPAFGAAVLMLDAAKGALPTWYALDHAAPWLVAATGAAAILGHCFSPFLAFTGGKGVATSAGVFLVLAPHHVLVAITVFMVVVAWRRVPALGSLAGAAALCALTIVRGEPWTAALAIGALALLVYTHRENLAQLTRS
jgi:glycerol-3-phosphate acyltransferase PlsY